MRPFTVSFEQGEGRVFFTSYHIAPGDTVIRPRMRALMSHMVGRGAFISSNTIIEELIASYLPNLNLAAEPVVVSSAIPGGELSDPIYVFSVEAGEPFAVVVDPAVGQKFKVVIGNSGGKVYVNQATNGQPAHWAFAPITVSSDDDDNVTPLSAEGFAAVNALGLSSGEMQVTSLGNAGLSITNAEAHDYWYVQIWNTRDEPINGFLVGLAGNIDWLDEVPECLPRGGIVAADVEFTSLAAPEIPVIPDPPNNNNNNNNSGGFTSTWRGGGGILRPFRDTLTTVTPTRVTAEPTGPIVSESAPATDGAGIPLLANSQIAVIRLDIGQLAYTFNNITAFGENAPFIEPATGRTMVPLRLVAELLGAQVGFDDNTRKANIAKGSKTLALTLDVELPEGMGVPVIVNGRTFVPIAYIARSLDADVEWDAAERAVYIKY